MVASSAEHLVEQYTSLQGRLVRSFWGRYQPLNRERFRDVPNGTLAEVWSSASDPQKERLRGFSPELLAVAVGQAIELEAMIATHEEKGQAKEATRAVLDAAERKAFSTALTLRDQAHNLLSSVAGHDKAAKEEVDQAVGTAESSDALVRGLEALITIANDYLAQKKGPVAKRAKLLRLDGTYVEKLDYAAKALSSAAKAAAARPAGKTITQGAVDRADGVNLLLLGQIIRAFDDAHDQDPAIPRLVPIATRRQFDRGTRKKKNAEAEAPQKDGET